MLKPLIDKIFKPGVSDIHLKAHEPPLVRHLGTLQPMGNGVLKPEDIEALTKKLLNARQLKELEESGDIDIGTHVEGAGRLRINIYRQRGNYAMAIRIIPKEIKSFEELHLNKETMEKLCRAKRGLILFSGVTGAGKTTTLSSMIHYMNQNFSYNIITIEDPIEFVHKSQKCSISQREVGNDVETFSRGLKYVLRQDPDVIVLGEMRTRETFQAAIEGAAAGHLVLATIHSSDTLDAVDRIVNAFDAQHQPYLRLQLTNSLRAIISQRLVQEKYGKDCYPASEVLFATLQIKKLLASGNLTETKTLIVKGHAYGMHTFDQDLLRLVDEGLISPQEAMDNASNPNDLRIKIQGQTEGNLEIIK